MVKSNTKFKKLRDRIKNRSLKHNPMIFQNKIQTVKQQMIIDQFTPVKFTHIPFPEIPTLPDEFQAYISKSTYLSYDQSSKLITISKQQFLDQENQKMFNLSIAQHEVKNCSIPKLVSINTKSLYKVNLWYYPQNRLTNYHFDSHDNFLYVLKGRKIVYLKKPGSLSCQSVFGINNNQSVQKNAPPDYRVVVGQGQCIYIPCGWFHKIFSIGSPIIAINYWGNSVSALPSCLHQIYLKYLISSISDNEVDFFLTKQIYQNQSLQKRQHQIMKSNIYELKQLNISTPFDFQILSQKLSKDKDLESIWTIINYQQFQKSRKQLREKIFLTYLKSIS